MTALRLLFLTRRQLVVLLVAVFVANLAETQLEEIFKRPDSYVLGYRIAQAFQEIEGGINFGGVELLDRWVVGIYAASYFLVFPALLVGAAIGAWRRSNAQVFRVFSLSIALNYLIALPFFLFVPVPERWAFPGAKATLLSDLLSTRLIEAVRPFSGLDNSFPSMHVALAFQVVLLAYWSQSHWRHSLMCLAGTVVLSAFALGIHWVPDLVMGGVVAALSFSLAVRLNRFWYRQERPRPAPAKGPRPSTRNPWRSKTPFPFATPATKQVFISYRREGGARLARVVQSELERRGYRCFLDVDDLGAEHFDDRLLKEIEQAPNFVLILAPGSLDRCPRPDDWLRREIEHALKHERNIVPLLADGFQLPGVDGLPESLQSLHRLNGVVYSHEYFNAAFDRLEGFLKVK